MWTSLDEIATVDLSDFAGIYIGGGNTYSLLHAVRSANAADRLVEYAMQGGVIYGGSAGAILLGSDIGTAARMDSNEAGLTDTSGLGLALGYAIWCHHSPEGLPLVREWTASTGRPVLAMSERAGVVREGGDLRVAGFEPVILIDGRQEVELHPDDRIPAV
jgi:dipeptidase E